MIAVRPAGAWPGRWLGVLALPAVAALAAFAVGVEATRNETFAVLAALAVILPLLIVWRPDSALIVLVLSVFLETLDFGGVAISRLAAPLALVVTIVALFMRQGRLKFAAPIGWAIAYGLWATASGMWTFSSSGTQFLLASLAIALCYMFAFGALPMTTEALVRVLRLLGLAAVITGLVAVLLFFTAGGGRSSGGRGDPNTFAAYQLITLPLVLVLATQTRSRFQRAFFYTSSAIIIGSVLTSLSRGGIITFAAVFLALILLPGERTMFASRGQKAAVLLTIVVVAGVAFKATSSELLPRIDTIFTSSGHTGSGRLNEWRGAITSIKERPWLGIGYGAFPSQSNQLMQRTPGVDLLSFDLRPHGILAHNTYLETTAELGFPGMFLFFSILVSTAVLLRRAAARARRAGSVVVSRIAGALQISLVAWAASAIFLSVETSRSLWILIGLALAVNRIADEAPVDEEPVTPVPRTG